MDEFKIILAGCGLISVKWLDHIAKRRDCEILAIVEKDIGRAEAAKAKYGLECGIYGSLEEALQARQANIVIDLTYVTVHHDIVTTALRAGCDVLGEKPMAFSIDEANDMLRVVDETGKRYIVMQNRRYIDQVVKIHDLVQSGVLGAPVMICGEIFVPADLASIRNKLPYPQLQDNNIHIFDHARYMAGGYPKSAYYKSFNPKGSKYAGDAAGVGIFEFDNGAVFNFRGYNGAEGMFTTWDHSWRLVCEKGTIIWDGAGDACYEVTRQTGTYQYERGVIKKPETVVDQHDLALADIFDALKTGRVPSTDCKDNMHSIAMVFACLRSIQEGRKVDIRVQNAFPYITIS